MQFSLSLLFPFLLSTLGHCQARRSAQFVFGFRDLSGAHFVPLLPLGAEHDRLILIRGMARSLRYQIARHSIG